MYLRTTSVLALAMTSTHVTRFTICLAILFFARHSYWPLSLRIADRIISSDRFLRLCVHIFAFRVSTRRRDVEVRRQYRVTVEYIPEIHELILAAVAADRAAVLKPRDFRRWLAAHLADDAHASALAGVLHGQRIDFGPFACGHHWMNKWVKIRL